MVSAASLMAFAEALMDAQGAHQNPVELRGAPGAVCTASRAALEEQFAVAWQLIAGAWHQVVKKAERRQVSFDGGRGFAASLEELHIRKNVLWRNVGQPFQFVPPRQKAAESQHGLVIALPDTEAALPVVAGQLVQLGS